MNKGGRPALRPGEQRKTSSVSLTHDQQIQFLRLGGSKWLREQIEKAIHEDSQKTIERVIA